MLKEACQNCPEKVKYQRVKCLRRVQGLVQLVRVWNLQYIVTLTSCMSGGNHTRTV